MPIFLEIVVLCMTKPGGEKRKFIVTKKIFVFCIYGRIKK
jgi:hypothetical protein